MDEVVDPDDRGWLATVADRLGKNDSCGFASTGKSVRGDSSGEVMGESKLLWGGEKASSESSGDRSDDDDEDVADPPPEVRSGAL